VLHLGANSAVLIRIPPYPGMTGGDELQLSWRPSGGIGHSQQIPITATGVGQPVLVRIPPKTVARSVGQVRVRYAIVDSDSNGRTSPPLDFTITP
jgi:hypothetical protein